MHAYFQRRYVAPNITVAVAGNFDWPSVVADVEKHCRDWLPLRWAVSVAAAPLRAGAR